MVAVKRGIDFDRPLLNERPITGQRKRKNGDKHKESHSPKSLHIDIKHDRGKHILLR